MKKLLLFSLSVVLCFSLNAKTTKATVVKNSKNISAGKNTLATGKNHKLTDVSFSISNTSNNCLSITFQLSQNDDGNHINFVMSPHSSTSVNVPINTWNIIISPACSAVNCTMQLNNGDTYGPAPGHTFLNENISPTGVYSMSVY